MPRLMQTERPVRVLAADLDGTLIPLDGEAANREDLPRLERLLEHAGVRLTFATGRHFHSVMRAMALYRLPLPDWIVCDVGTSIYETGGEGRFRPLVHYGDHLAAITSDVSTEDLAALLEPIDRLERQEDENQSRFKLSYYVPAESMHDGLEAIHEVLERGALPYSVVSSIDPFTGVGLVDLLPRGVSKAYALSWWSQEMGFQRDDIVYAGDSGNDSAVFSVGYRTIVVGNAAPEVVRHARLAHAAAGWTDRLYTASEPATSGVLAGLGFFLGASTH